MKCNSEFSTLRKLLRHGTLSKEQEAELAIRAKGGDDKAREKLILSNLRFAFRVAQSAFCPASVSREDLFSVAIKALVVAIDKYDPSRGRFAAFSIWLMRENINELVAQFGMGPCRIPNRRRVKLLKLRRAFERHLDNGTDPCIESLAGEVGLKRKTAAAFLCLGNPIQLDAPISLSEDGVFSDIVAGEDGRLSLNGHENAEFVECILSSLGQRERAVICDRFGIGSDRPQTYQEIGDKMGVSIEGVRQIEFKALRKLREHHPEVRMMRGLTRMAA